MKKNKLDELLNAGYPIEIQPIPEEDGGGYEASIPMLGRDAFIGDGETIKEALENLDHIKEKLLIRYIDQGIEIPVPKRVEDFSGKFVLRVPKFLHAQLVEESEKNDISLNTYCISLLSQSLPKQSLDKSLSMVFRSLQAIRTDLRAYLQIGTFSESSFSERNEFIREVGYGQAG